MAIRVGTFAAFHTAFCPWAMRHTFNGEHVLLDCVWSGRAFSLSDYWVAIELEPTRVNGSTRHENFCDSHMPNGCVSINIFGVLTPECLSARSLGYF